MRRNPTLRAAPTSMMTWLSCRSRASTTRRTIRRVWPTRTCDTLCRVPHVLVGRTRRIVRLVVLARDLQLSQVIIDVGAARSVGFRRIVEVFECQRWRACEQSAHQHHRSENIRPRECAPARDSGAVIVADHGGNGAIADRRHQPEHISHLVEKRERRKIVIESHVRTAAVSVTAEVRCDDVKARAGERRNHPSPAISEFGKPVDEQDAWPRRAFESCLQYVVGDAVDIVDEARTDTGGEGRSAVGYISAFLSRNAQGSRKTDRHGRKCSKKLTPWHRSPPSIWGARRIFLLRAGDFPGANT